MAKIKKSINSKSVKLPQQSKLENVSNDSIDKNEQTKDDQVVQQPEKTLGVDDTAQVDQNKKTKSKTSKKKTKTKTATFIPVDMSMSNVDYSKQDVNEEIVDAYANADLSIDAMIEEVNDIHITDPITTIIEETSVSEIEVSSIETLVDEVPNKVESNIQEDLTEEQSGKVKKNVLKEESKNMQASSVSEDLSKTTETVIETIEQSHDDITKDSQEMNDVEQVKKIKKRSLKQNPKSFDKISKTTTQTTKDKNKSTLNDVPLSDEYEKVETNSSEHTPEQKSKSNPMLFIVILILLVVGATSFYIIQNHPTPGDFNRDVIAYGQDINDLDLEALKINLQNPEFGFKQVDYDTVNEFSYFVKESDVPGFYIFVQFGQTVSFHLKNDIDLFVSDRSDAVETITIQSNNLYYKSFSIVDDSIVSIEILFDPSTLEVIKYKFSDNVTEDLETIMTRKDILNKVNFTISTYMELMEQLR